MPSQIQYISTFATYVRGDQIGSGGNGRVFAVTDDSGEQYALKVLDPTHATGEKRKRFQNEIQYCLGDNHENVIQVLDHGPHKDRREKETLFYVMPLYSETLRRLMVAGTPSEKLLGVLIAVMRGVRAAHERGTWHRDLKPENILISDDLAKVVVADWGIAHFSEDMLHTLVETNTATRLANFEYAAPEQCRRGQPVDHRADIYAIGLMLNEIFTRSVARGANPRSIADVNGEFAFLDDLVWQMILQDPSQRPPNLSEVLGEIDVRRELAASSSRIQALEQTRIETESAYDPLRGKAVELLPRSAQYKDGVLSLRLSQPVTAIWVQSFKRQTIRGSILDRHRRPMNPHTFSFSGDVISVDIDEANVPRLIPDIKQYLREGGNQYDRDEDTRQRQREEAARELIKKRLEDERTRQATIKRANELI